MLFALALLLGSCGGKTTLYGVIKLHEDARPYNIKDTKTKRYYLHVHREQGKTVTDSLTAIYKLWKEGERVAIGNTDATGHFVIPNLEKGTYLLHAKVTKWLQIDTTLFIGGKKRQDALILMQDHLYNQYLDSLKMSKYPYNEATAVQDVARNHIRILRAGLIRYSDQIYDSVTQVYGFKFQTVAGCVVQSGELEAIGQYNEVVYRYLDSINTAGWRDRLYEGIRIAELKSREKRE